MSPKLVEELSPAAAPIAIIDDCSGNILEFIFTSRHTLFNPIKSILNLLLAGSPTSKYLASIIWTIFLLVYSLKSFIPPKEKDISSKIFVKRSTTLTPSEPAKFL